MERMTKGQFLRGYAAWILLAAIIAAAVLELFCVRVVPVRYVPQAEAPRALQAGEAAETMHRIDLYPERFPEIEGFLLNRSTMRLGNFVLDVPGTDASMTFYRVNDAFTTVDLRFSEPLAEDLLLTVHLSHQEADFSRIAPVQASAKAGDTEARIGVPRGFYADVKVETTGSFQLERLGLEDDLAGYTRVAGRVSPIRVLLFVVGAFIVLCLLVRYTRLHARALARLRALLYWLRGHGAALLAGGAVVLLLTLLLYMAFQLLDGIHLSEMFAWAMNWYRLLFCLAAALVAAVLFGVRRSIGEHPQRGFLAVILILGTLYAAVMPYSMLITFDDAIHYRNAVLYATPGTPYATIPEARMFIRAYEGAEYSIREVEAMVRGMNADAARGAVETLSRAGKQFVTMIGYLPVSAMLALSRILGLPFIASFILGRLGNLLLYSIVTFFAVRRLRSGKLLLSLCALFPAMVFLTSGYNYDGWITALLFLGFATLFSQLQQPGRKVGFRDALGIILPLLLGCLIKAVYFPVMLAPLLLRKDRFGSPGQRRAYRFFVVLAGLLIILTFLPTFVQRPEAYVDSRASEGTGGVSQLSVMLANPFGYLAILIRAMVNNLKLPSSQHFMTFFAYLGHPPDFVWHIALVMTILLAVLDRNDADAAIRPEDRLVTIGACLLALAMMATALYIGFTPVGSQEIDGFQYRYVLPVLFPMLYMLGSAKVRHTLDRNALSMAVFGISALMLLISVYDVCVSKYFV